MKLSVIITTLDDGDLPNTVASIRSTAGDGPEIIVVSDAGFTALSLNHIGNVKVIRNSVRVGVGPSRTIGAHYATGDYLLLCDSHMRFTPSWYDGLENRFAARPNTIHCATCAGLDSENMNPAAPKAFYYGATIRMYGRDQVDPSKTQVLEGVWNKGALPDDAELCCVMGAAYFMRRDWFFKLDALSKLRSWGSDEVALSVKSWLAGGDCRLMRNVIIGHKFLTAAERQPYTLPPGHALFNKLFLAHTLFPDDLRDYLLEKMQLLYGGGAHVIAKKMIAENWHLVEVERARNKAMFTRDFNWLVDKFKL